MDKQATKTPTHVGRFLIVVLLALALVFLNLRHIKFAQFSISGAKSVWIRYPAPKNHSTLQQEVKMPKTEWIHKLMQYGYQTHSFTLEERTEGTVLMKMIEWPKIPDTSVPFRKSSDPLHTCFIVLNPEKTFHVGDQLQVMLRMFDFDGNPKQYGGDYLQARIHTPDVKAGSAGTVIDNQNGFYYINFTLSWPGKVQVSVSLVHPSEGVKVLKRLREERPDRIYMQSTFKAGAISKTTVCSLFLTPTKPLCNFTDLRTGEPWFCYKPENLPCSTRINHAGGGRLTDILIGEERLFIQSKVNVKMPILPCAMGYIIVEPSPQPSKIIFNHSVQVFFCLGIRRFDLGNREKTGPLCAFDVQNNIMLEYFAHGPPIYFVPFSSRHVFYISNKLNEIEGGKNTVITICICAHFCIFPVEVYIRRLQHIRRSVLQLLSRNPDTVVVIKTVNVRALIQDVILNYSDWYSFQLDLVLRRMFAGINVAFVDAWAMTIAHYLPHNLHPQQIIIKNEIDVFLSHVCPSNKW
ncbi:NXPE family member 3-like [Leucoraja erinacea]|uniref:NXPE family member 3-like n=1 Tax=Leucoraja erinaceus TaxID=7782 RepID=UPI002455C23F|nr:NXPE family member 3-like [Leucoraja erinacea]